MPIMAGVIARYRGDGVHLPAVIAVNSAPAAFVAILLYAWTCALIQIMFVLQTYTEAAKANAASAADVTAEKLQDLKVGLVGQDGAVSSRN